MSAPAPTPPPATARAPGRPGGPRRPAGTRLRLPVHLHLPSVRGRARADAGPLLLAVLVVPLATVLGGAVPAAERGAADRATSDAVATAGSEAAVVADVPLERRQTNERAERDPRSAALTDDALAMTRGALPRELAAVLNPPVARVVSEPLGAFGHGTGRALVLAYVTAGRREPRVRWTSGRAPRASVAAGQERVVRPIGRDPWTVEVGLVESAAAALGLHAGDVLQVEDVNHQLANARISGVYQVVDVHDPEWFAVPGLVRPTSFADRSGRTFLTVAGLLSRESLPDARIAINEDQISQQVSYRPDPARIRWGNADAVVEGTVLLQTGTGTPPSGADAAPPTVDLHWYTGLDRVVRQAQARITAAMAQGSVLLGGLVAAAALVLALAADLLARRRATVLAGARERGASAPGLALELGVESVAVAAAGVGLGAAVMVVTGGDVLSAWVLAPVAVAVLAPVVTGLRLALAATSGRQAPANRSARRTVRRTRQLRRGAAEVAAVLVAVAAFVALRQRGVVPDAGRPAVSGDLLPALAPALGALAGALLLRRVVPAAARRAVRRAARSARALPLVAAARVASASGAALPFVVVTATTALLGVGAAVVATAERGQELAAWESVGADARLTTPPAPAVADLARRVATAPGVDAAVAARVADGAVVSGEAGAGRARLVVVDPGAWARLRARTPLPAVPGLAALQSAGTGAGTGGAGTGAGTGGAGTGGAGTGGAGTRLPVLLRSTDRAVLQSRALRVAWEGRALPLQVVGAAPALGDADDNVIVVDSRAAEAAGLPAVPDTVWAVGPGAARALTPSARTGGPAASTGPQGSGDGTGVVTVRIDVLRDRRAAPLPAALRELAVVSAVVLVAFGVLGLVLGAATSAPGRGETLARLRTLGLRRREAWRVMLGELLPGAVVATLGGLAVGVLQAAACIGSLSLRLVTGQVADPDLVVPWWTVVPAVLVASSLAAVVAVESSARRRERLGLVLRAGGS